MEGKVLLHSSLPPPARPPARSFSSKIKPERRPFARVSPPLSFQDIALFLPTMVGLPKGSGGTVFLAFHVNCPNRYLSEESVNNARQDLGSSPAFILGRIIMIEQQVATEVGVGGTCSYLLL